MKNISFLQNCTVSSITGQTAIIREDNVFDYKFVGLSHNTLRGAAGGAVLIAELLTAQKYITAK